MGTATAAVSRLCTASAAGIVMNGDQSGWWQWPNGKSTRPAR